jgi:hypothetical protein
MGDDEWIFQDYSSGWGDDQKWMGAIESVGIPAIADGAHAFVPPGCGFSDVWIAKTEMIQPKSCRVLAGFVLE